MKDIPTFVTICGGEQYVRLEGVPKVNKQVVKKSEFGAKFVESFMELQTKESKAVANKAYSLVNKLLSNLIAKYDPKNNKFKTIKTANKTLKKKLFAYPDAVSMLMMVGFLPDQNNEFYTNNLKPDEL